MEDESIEVVEANHSMRKRSNNPLALVADSDDEVLLEDFKKRSPFETLCDKIFKKLDSMDISNLFSKWDTNKIGFIRRDCFFALIKEVDTTLATNEILQESWMLATKNDVGKLKLNQKEVEEWIVRCGPYKDVKRWAKKGNLGGANNSIFDLWKMIVPINIGNLHWTSIHVDFKTKAILYLDSMGGGGQKYLNLVMHYLKGEHLAKFDTSLDESEWTMKSFGRTIPQQQNGSDCGTFTCTFAIYATDTLIRGCGLGGSKVHGLPFEFGQEDMPYMRRRLALDILQKRLD